jgi:hypothetical protein
VKPSAEARTGCMFCGQIGSHECADTCADTRPTGPEGHDSATKAFVQAAVSRRASRAAMRAAMGTPEFAELARGIVEDDARNAEIRTNGEVHDPVAKAFIETAVAIRNGLQPTKRKGAPKAPRARQLVLLKASRSRERRVRGAAPRSTSPPGPEPPEPEPPATGTGLLRRRP